MALSDLLWACPECGEVGAVSPDGACRCGVRYRRGRGARILATYPDGRQVERTASEWVDRLPPPSTVLASGGEPEGKVRVARVVAREEAGSAPVWGLGRFLNRIETYGEPMDGILELGRDHVVFRPEGGQAREWPMEQIRAIQASSSTLQIRPRGQPLVSFRFTEDSVLLWELLLQAALADFYRRTGRGEIVEFQPRIATGP